MRDICIDLYLALFDTAAHIFEGNTTYSFEEGVACEIIIFALLAIFDMLNYPLQFGVFGRRSIDKLTVGKIRVAFILAEEELIFVGVENIIEAGKVDFAVDVGVDSSDVIEVEKSENVCPFREGELLNPL